MKSYQQFLDEQNLPGTYAAVVPDEKATYAINDFLAKNKVPNPEKNLHVTLLYSRKNLPNYVPDSYLSFIALPSKIDVWPTKSGKNCLVLKLISPDLEERHKYLMKEHGATYDYSEYKPHISLSYDIGDFDASTLSVDDLPKILVLTREYTEELDTTGK